MVLKTPLSLQEHNLMNGGMKAERNSLRLLKHCLAKNISDDVFLIATSGRYEFRNKGIDLFIDALGELNSSMRTCNGLFWPIF